MRASPFVHWTIRRRAIEALEAIARAYAVHPVVDDVRVLELVERCTRAFLDLSPDECIAAAVIQLYNVLGAVLVLSELNERQAARVLALGRAYARVPGTDRGRIERLAHVLDNTCRGVAIGECICALAVRLLLSLGVADATEISRYRGALAAAPSINRL